MLFIKVLKLVLKFFKNLVKWGFVLVLVIALLSFFYNLTLSEKSEVTDRLTESQKAYIAETMNLQQKLGNLVWPSWGDISIPVIVYNEEYAFLVGHGEPPVGWYKMPRYEHRGSEWVPLTNDSFFGETYYRQRLTDPNITPENFTVKVGDGWVASMQTKEYAEVEFYNGFRNDLPPILKSIFPYKLFWNLIMGKAEYYIAGLAHEAFHAFQGTCAFEKLKQGEEVAFFSDQYPWFDDVNANGWVEEIDVLMKAYKADSYAETKGFAKQFLETRKQRRVEANLTDEQIGFEQKREWLEGLAKYAELLICIEAQLSSDYRPIKGISTNKDFKGYNSSVKRFQQQVQEVPRTAKRRGDSRFYYGGMLQAVILDILMPNWKEEALENEVYLDELLSKAVSI